MKAVFVVLYFISAVTAWAVGSTAGPYRVDLTTDPAIVPVGKATLTIKVTNAAGGALSGLQVKGIAQMPGMPMGEREQIAVPGDEPGAYRMPASFAMAGGYEAKISISGPLGSAVATVPLETGKSTAATEGGSFPWATFAWVVIGFGVVAFVVYRMRKTGQRLEVRSFLTGSVLVTLALFGVVLFGAIYAVNHFRRPGAMTPVEAQTMDMNAPAPEGVVPATLASVEMRSFHPSVNYSGQVVGFVEQEVYPRVTGSIVWMPFYVGDTVHKGQVLARLDTSQIVPQVNDKSAQVQSALSGVGSAEAEYQQALAAVSEAEAEHAQHQGMLEESEADLIAARDARDAAGSQVQAAGAGVENAREGVTAAEADQQYWSEELQREAKLLAAGAVSKEEYQKEKAEAGKSAAALLQAHQDVAAALAKLRAAQAADRQAAAGIVASQKKVDQARAEVMAHHAHVATTQAASRAAKQRIDQASAGVAAARAGLQSAEANASYTEIRAESDGVITQRLISPGVLVNPGQAILKVAQIQPIRVQADVAEADLSRIQVGSTVQIWHQDKNLPPVAARVSSISPSLDPVARTGVVEAVLPNRDKAFLPGQFVSMDLAVSSSGEALVIPIAALQTEVEPSSNDVISTSQRNYVWLATPLPGQDGKFTISRQDVEAGNSSDDWVAIKSGLAAGQQVVSSPATSLRAGQTVAATPAPGTVALSQVTVSITEQGFEPPSVSVRANHPARITFIRKTSNTCATEVVFPSLNIRRKLPLNVQVSIDLPAQSQGELNYVCGMNMLKGKVVVQ